ncbi:unnamed protein product [Sympodiomycopsis kandeliae]
MGFPEPQQQYDDTKGQLEKQEGSKSSSFPAEKDALVDHQPPPAYNAVASGSNTGNAVASTSRGEASSYYHQSPLSPQQQQPQQEEYSDELPRASGSMPMGQSNDTKYSRKLEKLQYKHERKNLRREHRQERRELRQERRDQRDHYQIERERSRSGAASSSSRSGGQNQGLIGTLIGAVVSIAGGRK